MTRRRSDVCVQECNIVIATALLPGQKAPIILTNEMMKEMKKGSVIVDLTAEAGGNTEATVPGEINDVNGVKVIGFSDLASHLFVQSSSVFASNIFELVSSFYNSETDTFNIDHDAHRNALVCYEGRLMWSPATSGRAMSRVSEMLSIHPPMAATKKALISSLISA